MSQAKVDKYKEEKKNRAKIMAKEKREWMLTKVGGGVLGLAVVAWIGISVYQNVTAPKASDSTPVEMETYTVDTSALDNYISNLTAD